MIQTSDLYKKPGDHASPPSRPNKRLQRLAKLLPLALLLACILLLALLFGDRFMPSRAVQLESVVTQRSLPSPHQAASDRPDGLKSFTGKALFQASGWIEADPLPFHVRH